CCVAYRRLEQQLVAQPLILVAPLGPDSAGNNVLCGNEPALPVKTLNILRGFTSFSKACPGLRLQPAGSVAVLVAPAQLPAFAVLAGEKLRLFGIAVHSLSQGSRRRALRKVFGAQ